MGSKFKYLWQAVFVDDNGGSHTITQPPDDKYSKHDPEAEWNPSAFRDFQEYFDNHQDELREFRLDGEKDSWILSLQHATVTIFHAYKDEDGWHRDIVHSEERHLENIRPIYYRKCESQIVGGELVGSTVLGYVIGYQGNLPSGENVQYEHFVP